MSNNTIISADQMVDQKINNATIEGFDSSNESFVHKMHSLGVCEGCSIEVLKKSVFADPIIFDIEGTSIAIRKEDAQQIKVSVN